jgi:osmotically-inducible protein OsmY
MAEESKAARIERAIREVAELDVVVEDQGGTLVLEGIVDSERDRQAAEDIAADLAGDAEIDNALEVQDLLPVSVDAFSDEQRSADQPERPFGLGDDDGALNPDFTDQPQVRDAEAVSGPTDSVDDEDEDDGNWAYVPPTDPVVTTDAHGQAVVLGGFGTSALDENDGEDLAENQGYGDEAVADAVRRALREDAATTELPVRVVVREGVVHLHGRVEDLDDADSAEEVASRVPGVREVLEELRVDTID